MNSFCGQGVADIVEGVVARLLDMNAVKMSRREVRKDAMDLYG
jgi:hypothetical protein